MRGNTVTVGKVIGKGWDCFKARPWFWIGVSLICTAIPEIIDRASTSIPEMVGQSGGSTEFVYLLIVALFVLNTLVSIRISMGMVCMGLATVNGKTVKIGDLLAKPQLFWRYVLASISFGLMIMVGLILLVVPGVYLAARFLPVHYVLVERETGVLESFRQAERLTAGYRGKLIDFILLGIAALVVLTAILFFIAMMSSLPVSEVFALLIGVVAQPIIILSLASFYRALRDAPADRGAA